MIFAFGVSTPSDSLVEQLPLIVIALLFGYGILLGMALFGLAILYIILKLLPQSVTDKLILEPKIFILQQAFIFPAYFLIVLIASLPISEKDYEFTFYVGLYAVLILVFMAGYQVIMKRRRTN